MPQTIQHRDDIDLLRSLAVLLVVFFHADLSFPGGFVGVDVFFVISGFLITGNILRERDAGTFSLSNFWIRRTRRILPAATFMTCTTLLVGAIILQPAALKKLAESAFAQQLICSNIYFCMTGGYFDGPAELKPLLHTWSLCVEEQFYLFFPLLFLGKRKLSRRRLGTSLAIFCAISLGLSEYAATKYPVANLFLLPTRAWEILFGGLLAFASSHNDISGTGRSVLSSLGVLLVFGAAMTYDSTTRFPGANALIPVLGAAFCIFSNGHREGLIASKMAGRPLVLIGKASYSIYLWHWPIIVYARLIFGEHLPLHVRICAVSASLIVGSLSWAIIEEPIRNRRFLRSDTRMIIVAIFALVCMLILTTWIRTCEGLQFRLPKSAAMLSDPPFAKTISLSTTINTPHGLNIIGAEDTPLDRLDFMLWGDSHAASVSRLFERLATERHIRGGYASHPGLAPLLDVHISSRPENKEFQLNWSENVVNFVNREQIKNVFIAARWESKLNGEGKPDRLSGFICDAETVTPSRQDAMRVFEKGLLRTIDASKSTGTHFWLIPQIPRQKSNHLNVLVWTASFHAMIGTDFTADPHRFPRGVPQSTYEEQQAQFFGTLKGLNHSRLHMIKAGENWFDDQGFSRSTNGNQAFYTDGDHVSIYGAEEFYCSLLEPIFDQIIRDAPP